MSKTVLILDAMYMASSTSTGLSNKKVLGPMGSVFENAGAEVVNQVAARLKNVEEVIELITSVDALVIPGGIDVHPVFYDHPWDYNGGGNHTVKGDFHQMEAIRQAVMQEKKVFGICRGLQVLNVAFGGTLIQDHEGHRNGSYTPTSDRFKATSIKSDNEYLEGFDTVSCFHHQCINELGAGLNPIATAHDGIVEAVTHDSGLVFGVQFHPESDQTIESQLPRFAEWIMTA
jgi:putative glutamine amidotransferase